MQKDAFWSLLEQIRDWNGYHMLGAKRMDEIEGFLIHCSHMHIQSFTPKPCTCFPISLFIHLAATPHAFLAFPLHSPFNQHMHPLTKKSFIPHAPKTPPEIIIAVGTYPISDCHSTSLHMHLHNSTHAFIIYLLCIL